MEQWTHPNFLEVVHSDVVQVLSANLPWSDLNGKHIVVTGAAGFLGSGLIRSLLALHPAGLIQSPLKVIGLVRNQNQAIMRLSDLSNDPQLQLMEWDLRTLATPDLGSPDFVIHAASKASPSIFSHDPVGTLLPNTIGTAALLRAMSAASRFIFVSSSEVYGEHYSSDAVKETDFGFLDPTSVRSCYAEGKRLGEALCTAWYAQYGMHASIVRLFHTYGPGLRSDDGRVFADFAYSIAQGKPIVMTSDGQAKRAFCYASDATAGILTVLLKGESGRAYNLGNPSAFTSILELANLLCSNFREQGAQLEYRPAASGYLVSTVNRILPDISRLRALGWTPKIGLSEGFNRFIQAITS
jgi:UDP-glucuronate decarboxylase